MTKVTRLQIRTFFKEAQKGVVYVSNPFLNEDQKLSLYMAAPIADTGKVLYGSLPYEAISAELTKIKIGESGYAFVIDKNGATVIHPNNDDVSNPRDYFELAKKDSSYAPTAKIFKEMTSGKTGTGFSYYNGQRRLVGYTPLNGPEGWSVAVTTPLVQIEKKHELYSGDVCDRRSGTAFGGDCCYQNILQKDHRTDFGCYLQDRTAGKGGA